MSHSHSLHLARSWLKLQSSMSSSACITALNLEITLCQAILRRKVTTLAMNPKKSLYNLAAIGDYFAPALKLHLLTWPGTFACTSVDSLFALMLLLLLWLLAYFCVINPSFFTHSVTKVTPPPSDPPSLSQHTILVTDTTSKLIVRQCRWFLYVHRFSCAPGTCEVGCSSAYLLDNSTGMDDLKVAQAVHAHQPNGEL